MPRKIALFLGYGLLTLIIIAVVGAIWSALILGSLKTTPSFPWCLPALLLILWLLWNYLGGKGWPQSTSEKRRHLRRANSVSRAAFGWTALTGALAITALAGIWIVFFQLFRMPANPLLRRTSFRRAFLQPQSLSAHHCWHQLQKKALSEDIYKPFWSVSFIRSQR